MQHSQHYLVIGATGKTGRRVVAKLQEAGEAVRQASRHSDCVFDWTDPATWAASLENIDAVYLTYYPDLAVPRAPDDIRAFCQLAAEKGVKKLVLLSGRGEPAAQRCEEIVRQSGLTWSIIRAAWFSQNFTDGLFHQFVMSGEIALPVSLVQEPFIDIDDIAHIAFQALTTDGHDGALYEVTGPELLSFAQVASRFSMLLNRPVRFTQISAQAFEEQLSQAGVEQGAIEMLRYLFSEVLDGRNAHTTSDVERALGRPATSFNTFVLRNLAAFEEVSCLSYS